MNEIMIEKQSLVGQPEPLALAQKLTQIIVK